MLDIRLWRLLQQPTWAVEEVVPLLQDLAELPLAERMPYLGLIQPLVEHPDTAVRAAALHIFKGTLGRRALTYLVEAFEDPVEEVRVAALDAFHQSAVDGSWCRWVHALFHPNPWIRQQALRADRSFPMPAEYQIYLYDDPECRPIIEERLTSQLVCKQALPLLFDYLRRDCLPSNRLRQLTLGLNWDDWQYFLGWQAYRSEELTSFLDEAMAPQWGEEMVPRFRKDRLDEILELFWDEDAPGTQPSPHQHFFDLLWNATLASNWSFQSWIALSLLVAGYRRGGWPSAAAQLCAALYPPFLLCPWVDFSIRQAALAGLYRGRERCPRWPVERLQPIFESEICWIDVDGEHLPDLYAVGAILHALDGKPYDQLLKWVPLQLLARAYAVNQSRSIAVLGIPGVSSQARSRLIREFALIQGPGRNALLAQLILIVPSDSIDFLGSLDGAEACHLFEELLAVETLPSGKNAFSENKVRTLARVLSRKIASGQVAHFLGLWLQRPYPEDSELALAITGQLIHDHATRQLLPALIDLPLDLLRRFLRVLPFCAGFPYDEEIELARRLAVHSDKEVNAWVKTRLRDHQTLQESRSHSEESSSSSPSVRLGLCRELEWIMDPVSPDIERCQALLASHDPPHLVLRQLQRFLPGDRESLNALDADLVKHWRGEPRLPFLGHLWLYRWDQHRAVLADLLTPTSIELLPFSERSLAGLLRWATSQPILEVGKRAWQAAASLLRDWRFHQPGRYQSVWDDSLIEVIVTAVQTPLLDLAIALALHGREHAKEAAASQAIEQVRQRLIRLLPSIPEESRKLLAGWINVEGVPFSPSKASLKASITYYPKIDLDTLKDWLIGEDADRCRHAAQQLLVGGFEGIGWLIRSLDERSTTRWPLQVLKELAECLDPKLRKRLRQLVGDVQADPEVRFRVGCALWPEGEDGVYGAVLEAACVSAAEGWFLAEDYTWLKTYCPNDALAVDLRLVNSVHPHAYSQAVAVLVQLPHEHPQVRAGLVAFLEQGTKRMRHWRIEAAKWLYQAGERDACVPVLLGSECIYEADNQRILVGLAPALVEAITDSVLLAGQGETSEEMLLDLLGEKPAPLLKDQVDTLARDRGLQELLSNATSTSVRQRARRALRSGMGRHHKLRRVAENFAWGVRLGRQLTGQLFTLEMIAGEELGYTRLNELKLHISAMPLLRGQRNAKEVVRGLILHEYGHHLYHKGPEAMAVWQEAEHEHLHRLLNLVSDEHLERNLRARDEDFGNYLKTLAAYAFHHNTREVHVVELLDSLHSRAFAVLSKSKLRVARNSDHVGVDNGQVLLEMEKSGMSFARFIRALRMGWGNRHGDDKVGRGLELFKGKFRRSEMPRLLEIARELQTIFGDEVRILDLFDQSRVLVCDSDELEEACEGITNEELQAAIRRAMEGASNKTTTPGTPGGRGYNTNPDEAFNFITHIVPMPHDPTRHGSYARQVARPAEKMRRFLMQLGLSMVPQRNRVQGKSVDRARLRRLVLHGEPRVLIARQIRFTTDLFVGVLIDCSGSMVSYANIEKAKLFGTLLAEASRGLPGVDLRLWGFTDRAIFDCGNALRPAVHDLEADNGNNDAAALWHAACVARSSRRRAKLLVMISDGSPTECSVAALKALVTRLTVRHHILCAQVAVRALDDICFPHYVLLEEDRFDEAMKKFGKVIVKLVRRALRG